MEIARILHNRDNDRCVCGTGNGNIMRRRRRRSSSNVERRNGTDHVRSITFTPIQLCAVVHLRSPPSSHRFHLRAPTHPIGEAQPVVRPSPFTPILVTPVGRRGAIF